MKTALLYDSAYGNTEKIAQAIGQALGTQEEVAVLRIGEVNQAQLAGLKLLIVGSPTQRLRPTIPTSNLLKMLAGNSLKGVKVAAFDTRLTVQEIEKIRVLAFFVRLFGGYAAPVIAKGLQKKGGELIAPPEGFYVEGMEGPLVDGELERAAAWARQISAHR